jgi:hypothetical protein
VASFSVNQYEFAEADVFVGKFICSRIKKRRKPRVKLSCQNYVEFGKADKAYMKKTPHVPLRQISEE